MNTAYTETVCVRNTTLDIPLHFASGKEMPMGYLDHLAEMRKRLGLSQAALAEKLGVEQPTVQRWEKGKREPDLGQLISLANVLGVEPGALLSGVTTVAIGPKLFIKGEVAAGVWRPAVELPEDEWQSFTGRSDVSANVDHRFGLRVVGDSMNLLYPPGTIVECVSLFGRAEAVPGKRVVVIRMDDDGQYEATVKELIEQDGDLWLVPRSSNPNHKPYRLSANEPGIVETRIAAVVVASVRPE